jgi:uncharacterized protein (DUF305 family)
MRSLTRRLVQPSLILVILALLILGSVARVAPQPARAAAMPFDQQFIDMMVPHHQGATAMATIALNRSNHPQINALAQAIIAAQDKEISRMKAWRKAWYGSASTPSTMGMLPGMPMGSMTMAMMQQDLTALKTAKPFDKAFMLDMIPHHESAIAAAKLELAHGSHAPLKALALSIIESQAREVGLMTAYLDLWYQSAPPSTMGGMGQ